MRWAVSISAIHNMHIWASKELYVIWKDWKFMKPNWPKLIPNLRFFFIRKESSAGLYYMNFGYSKLRNINLEAFQQHLRCQLGFMVTVSNFIWLNEYWAVFLLSITIWFFLSYMQFHKSGLHNLAVPRTSLWLFHLHYIIFNFIHILM